MMNIKSVAVTIIATLMAIAPTFALTKDVYVQGYYRNDGTYVRPHIRSAPDAIKSNNYGPSRSNSELMNPRRRDNDNDGFPNYLDHDDDNDGLLDDHDSNQYGCNDWYNNC